MLSLAACVLVTSCSHKVTRPAVESAPPADSLGTPLTPDGLAVMPSSDLAWSSLTNEVFFARDPDLSLVSINVLTRTPVPLDASGLALRVSGDGRTLFYVEAADLETFRLMGRDLISGVTGPIANPAFSYAVSWGDSLIAYSNFTLSGGVDSLYLLNLREGTRTSLNVDGFPITFSPDDANLLYLSFDDPDFSWRVQDLRTRATRMLAFGSGPRTGSITPPRWDAGGIHVLITGRDPWVVEMVTLEGGQQVRLFSSPDSLDFSSGVWSRDGSRVAFFADRFTAQDRGTLRETALWMVELASLRLTRIAHGPGLGASGIFPPPTQHALFSPDGRTIAYVIGDRIYTSPVP